MTVVIHLESSAATAVSVDVKGSIPTATVAKAMDGMKGRLMHSIIAKANLDETRNTPGARKNGIRSPTRFPPHTNAGVT